MPAAATSGGDDTKTAQSSGIFTTPASIKRLFSHFPLKTYPPNELPLRAPLPRREPVLYVFCSPEEAARGAPSYNPSCLKWQTYLKIRGIRFTIEPSNNHASPSGSLPFLLPAHTTANQPAAIRSNSLQKWAHEQLHPSTPSHTSSLSTKDTLYLRLIDNPLRLAYLYTFYLDTSALTTTTQTYYVHPSTTNTLVRTTLTHALRHAAESELLNSLHTPQVDVAQLFRDAEEALHALSTRLAQHTWFGQEEGGGEQRSGPNMLDAAVFSYTHLFLRPELRTSTRLGRLVLGRENLIAHCQRMLDSYFEETGQRVRDSK